MSGLTEIEIVVVANDVYAKKGFQVVALSDDVFLFQNGAKFVDKMLASGCDGKVVDVCTEDDLFSVRKELVKEATVEGTSTVAMLQ